MFGKYFVQKHTQVGQCLFFHKVLCFVATLKLEPKYKRLWNLLSSVYRWMFDLLSYNVVFSYIEDFDPDMQPNKNNFQKKK